MGLIASCDMSFDQLVQHVADACGGPVRFSPAPRSHVTRVAIVAGSGMSFYDDALASNADVFITADVKYHGFHAAMGHIGLVDPGHFEMEQFVPSGLCELLCQHIMNVEFITSAVRTAPTDYALPSQLRSQTFSLQS
jgi:putative NIF3 family GTP cyclohydrolase 1 type 2